jgi:hypothetical protein
MRLNLQKLHAQNIKWRFHGIIVFWWAFFYVNNNKEVDCNKFQIMHFFLCYNNLVNASSFKTQTRKCLISYYKINGTTTFRKHVNENHAIVAKTFEGEINSPLRKNI